MTVAKVRVGTHPQSIAPGLCQVRMWPLPADSPHHAESRARKIIREMLCHHMTADTDVVDTEQIVAELAVNAVQHATAPYELRIVLVAESWPAWCEVADSSRACESVRRLLRGDATTPRSDDTSTTELAERGRGLRLVGGLSYGRCAVYPTTVCRTGAAGKAVGFAPPVVDAALSWSRFLTIPGEETCDGI